MNYMSNTVAILEALMTEPARVMWEAAELVRSASARRSRREDYVRAWEEALDMVPLSSDLVERAAEVARRIRAVRQHMLSAYVAAVEDSGCNFIRYESLGGQQFRVGLSAVGDALVGDAWLFDFELVFSYSGEEQRAAAVAAAEALPRAHTRLIISASVS